MAKKKIAKRKSPKKLACNHVANPYTPLAIGSYADRLGLKGAKKKAFVKEMLKAHRALKANPMVKLATGSGGMIRPNPLLVTVGANPPKKRTKKKAAKKKVIKKKVAKKKDTRKRKANPALADITKLPGYAKAAAKFSEFHGISPSAVKVIRVNDGKKGVTRKVVTGLGMAPEVHYTSGKIKGSNKDKYHYVHKTKKGKEPYLVWNPDTKTLELVGGAIKTKDWLYD